VGDSLKPQNRFLTIKSLKKHRRFREKPDFGKTDPKAALLGKKVTFFIRKAAISRKNAFSGIPEKPGKLAYR